MLQSRLAQPLAGLRLRKRLAALLFHPAQPTLFVGLLLPRVLHVVAQLDQSFPLCGHLVAERLHAADQGAIVLRDDVQVLVARDQLAERLR